MEKIFNLPYVGDLFLEHTFYMLDDEPILFVCKGIGDIRYLCSCCRLYEKWVVGQVAETELINLIDDKVSIREVFENCDTKFVVRWDGKRFKVDGDVHDSLLPKAGALLELDREKCGAYRGSLVKYRKQWQSIKLATQQSNNVLSAWKQYQETIFTWNQYQEVCSKWKQDQELYASLLKEWKSLGPVIDEVSRIISSAISIQLTHQNADYWEKLAQYIQSVSTVAEAEDKEEQVQKQALSVKQTTETYGSVHNEAPCNDEIQYLAA